MRMKNWLFLLSCVFVWSCKDKHEKVIYLDRPFDARDTIGEIGVMYDKDGNIIYDGTKEAQTERKERYQYVEGLNNSYYEFAKDSLGNKQKIRVFSYNYSTEYYQIDMANDTITLGDDFKGRIWIATATVEDYKVSVWENGESKVLNKADLSNGVYLYTVKTDKEGSGVFKGVVNIKVKGEWREIPFEYKYVVVNG